MGKDRDLLPWILGGLSTATVAVAITLGSTYGNAPKNSEAPGQITSHILPEAIAPTAPARPPAPAEIPPAAQIQTPAPPTTANGQIWECTIDGQKTFSDSPCGNKPSLREIGPVNGMDPTPILPRARSFAPRSSYQPEYSFPGEQVDSTPGDQQFADAPYPVFVGIPVHDRRRPDHGHRPHDHDRGSQPRRN
jgi:hypothetical protein